MKRILYTALFLSTMLVSLVGTAAASPLASGTARLVGVHNSPYKGPVFTFEVSGHFSRSQLRGTVAVQGGGNYGLYCTQQDDNTVVCNTSKAVSGVNVRLTWGGSEFWTYVPEAPDPTYCYDVYDWNSEGEPVEWVNYGSYCQQAPAEYGDLIIWYNPGWEQAYIYQFLSQSPESEYCSFTTHYGNAYYFPSCFEGDF